MEEKTMDREQVSKRLGILFWIYVVSMALSLLGVLPAMAEMMPWLGAGMRIASAIVLFSLAQAGGCYRLAGILGGIAAAGNLLLTLIGSAGGVLAMALNICALVGLYNEYKGHAELIQEQEDTLARRWTKLFVWNIVLSLVSMLLAINVSVLGAAAGMSVGTMTMLGVALASIPAMVVDVLYLVYLNRTRHLVEEGL